MKNGVKIRWITTTCFEIKLPSGKTIIFDPWTGGEDPAMPGFTMDTGFTVDDFEGADYIFLSHTHGDHILDVKELLQKKQTDPCGGHVFVPALSAKIFSDVYDVPLVNLIPVYPYETFDLDEITATPLPCRHFGDKGINVLQTPSEHIAAAKARGRDPFSQQAQCMLMGNLEESDWAITIKENNLRFMVLGGRVYRFNNIYKYADEFHPDFVIRQVSLGQTPEDYAEMVAKYHTQIVWPSHHDSHDLVKASGLSYEEYFGRVNAKLAEMGSPCHVVNIKPTKWYNIGVSCEEE